MLSMNTIVTTSVICLGVQLFLVSTLAYQHRDRFPGLGFLPFSYTATFLSFFLLATINLPKFPIFIIVINLLSITGLCLLIHGCESIFNLENTYRMSAVVISLLLVSMIIFTYIRPSLVMRIITTSLVNLYVWAMVTAVVLIRRDARWSGVGIPIAYFSIPLILMTLFRTLNSASGINVEDFFHAPFLTELSYLLAQILLFGLTYSISLVIGRMLNQELRLDLGNRLVIERQLETTISNLEEAMSSIQTLEGLIPICSYCKKIRDDDGYWEQVENYISKHSQAKFTHSICQDCLDKYFPELADSVKDDP